jgi:hypothetical protein
MARRAPAAPTPIILLIASFLCPTELSLYIAGLRLPPHRVAVLILVPIALYRLLGRGDARLKSFDVLIFLFALWTVAAYWMHSGMDGVVFGGSLALESFGTYVVTRAFVRDANALRGTLRIMLWAIVAAGLIALPETLLGQTFTHDMLRQLTGYVHPTTVEFRAGLTRAYGTFDHPIHYGSFCASMLALFWFAEKKLSSRATRLAVLAGATALGLSSAPLLTIALQLGLIAWERTTRGYASRISISLACLAGLYIGISLVATRSPAALIATGFTLDNWTGFYRLQIWTWGTASVANNPWTGIGLADWARPDWMVSSTIDAFWLVLAMRTGLPTTLLLVAAIALLLRAVVQAQANRWDRPCQRLASGWMISLIVLCLIGFTVHYWNVVHAYFFFFLGLGGWLADPKHNAAGLKAVAAKRRRRKAVEAQTATMHPMPQPLPAY